MRAATLRPAALDGLPEGQRVDLDVREDLLRGKEPFSRIMAAVAALVPGQVLVLRAPFEPAPLYRVLGQRGFAHWTESHAADDWSVWIYPDRVGLDVRGLEPPAVAPPDGVSTVNLADRPDLVEGVFHVAEEAFPDIPSIDNPMRVGTLDEFRARDIERPGIPPSGFAIALDDATGRVSGYASLIFQPGSSTRAYNDMTAVVRAWRGRGVAAALKRATIAWAIQSGLEWLETGNDVANAPMRALNARLGYQPLPDFIEFRGPLAGDETLPPAG